MPVAQKLCCQVEQVIDHGGQVYSLELVPERLTPRFLPGQFLHLAVDAYEPGSFWPDSRVFSIASSPEDRQRLRITYAVKGKFTARMEQVIKPGCQVWVKLPYGDFIIRDTTDVVLIAGGTGVTAFTAFLAGLDSDFSHHVDLFYGARTRDLLIYRPLVEEIARNNSALSKWYYFEHGQADSPDETAGILSVEGAMQRSQNPANAEYYLSGPPTMLRSFSRTLFEKQVSPDRIHIDAWE